MSAKAAMMRLPTLWSERSPPPSKRSLKTSASFLRSARATRQFLTSPGGATPSSCLRRPLEPPSSATVTTAVRLPTLSRNPPKSTGRPVPPPNATTRNSSYFLIDAQYIADLLQSALTARYDRTRCRIAEQMLEPARFGPVSRGHLHPYCFLAALTASANRLAFSTTSPRSSLSSDDGARAPPAPTARAPAANQSTMFPRETPPVGTKGTSGKGPKRAFR